MPSFHSIEEQQAYERAEKAYDRYLGIREECRIAYQECEDEEKTHNQSLNSDPQGLRPFRAD